MIEPFIAALAPWAVILIVRTRKHSDRIKRGKPGAVRDQLLPEEVEAHWDERRRKRSDEIKALRVNGLHR